MENFEIAISGIYWAEFNFAICVFHIMNRPLRNLWWDIFINFSLCVTMVKVALFEYLSLNSLVLALKLGNEIQAGPIDRLSLNRPIGH